MNIEALAEIQPYIDEYCKAKKILDKTAFSPLTDKVSNRRFNAKIRMEKSETKVMRILIDSNCKEIKE